MSEERKSEKNIVFLVLVFVCSFGVNHDNVVFAEEEGETVNDTFSGFDGLVPKGWTHGGNAVWNGCKGTIQENKLKFVHVGKKLGFPSWRKLEKPWTDKTVLISYDFKMTAPVDHASYFPRITDGAEKSDAQKIVTLLSYLPERNLRCRKQPTARKRTRSCL